MIGSGSPCTRLPLCVTVSLKMKGMTEAGGLESCVVPDGVEGDV